MPSATFSNRWLPLTIGALVCARPSSQTQHAKKATNRNVTRTRIATSRALRSPEFHRHHLPLDTRRLVDRGQAYSRPSRPILREDLTIHLIERVEFVEIHDERRRTHDIDEIHAASAQHFANVGQHLKRLGLNPAGHELRGGWIASELPRQAGDERCSSI